MIRFIASRFPLMTASRMSDDYVCVRDSRYAYKHE